MRTVIQRVKKAKVTVDGQTISCINKGLLTFLGVGEDDDDRDLDYLVNKVLGLRIFQDENDKMNLSLLDVEGELLVVSQFTLFGDVRKGKRPSFTKSAHPDIANKYYEEFIKTAGETGIRVVGGVFGAHMDVSLINDGPVTIMIDSKKNF